MANIFNSKEIYMHIPHSIHGKETLVPINGLYVVGEYRSPFYIDGHLHISNIQTSKAKIANYTEATVSMPDHTFNILPVEVDTSTPIAIDYYTLANTNVTDHAFNILPIEVDTDTPISIDLFARNTVNMTDHVFNILPIEVDATTPIELTFYTQGYYGGMSESCLRIRTLTTTKAQISNVTI